MKTIGITGGSGFIGGSVIDELLGDSRYKIKALFRSQTEDSDRLKKRGVEIVLGDVEDQESIYLFTAGCDYIILCAASFSKTDYASAYKLNVTSTQQIAKSALAQGCKKIIFISSISVYAHTKVNHITEKVIPQYSEKLNAYSRTKIEGETELIKACAGTDLAYSILRPTNVYGKGSRQWSNNVVKILKTYKVAFGDVCVDFIHIKDLVSIIVGCIDNPRTDNQIFNVGSQSMSLKDFFSAYAKILSLPSVRVPGIFDYAIRFLLSHFHRVSFNIVPIPSMDFICQKNFSNALVTSTFDFKPKYSIESGILETCLATRLIHPAKVNDANFTISVAVASEVQIQELIQLCRTYNLIIKPHGAKGSKSHNFATHGIALNMSGCDSLVYSDTDQTITVGAGAKLRNVLELAQTKKRFIYNVGEWSGQTVSGAISTASHGGSLNYGSLAAAVIEFRFVDGNGMVHALTRKDQNFNKILTTCGAFGIITELKLETEKLVRLELTTNTIEFSDYLNSLTTLHTQNRFSSLVWFMKASKLYIYNVNNARSDDHSRGSFQIGASTGRPLRFTLKQYFVSLLYHFCGLDLIHLKKETYSGSPLEMLSPIRHISKGYSFLKATHLMAHETEVSFPYEDSKAILQTIQQFFEGKKRFLLLPTAIRVTKKDNFYLSPMMNRTALNLTFFYMDNEIDLFHQLLAALKEYNPRFHLGKTLPRDMSSFSESYPELSDTKKLANHFDPANILESPFTRKIGIH